MINKICADCYYNSQCDYIDNCDDFASLSNDMDDDEIVNIIEDHRLSFRKEWFEYIDKFNS